MDFTTLLKQAFDYEHWIDPDLRICAVKELGLENFWPLDQPYTEPEPRPGTAHDTHE